MQVGRQIDRYVCRQVDRHVGRQISMQIATEKNVRIFNRGIFLKYAFRAVPLGCLFSTHVTINNSFTIFCILSQIQQRCRCSTPSRIEPEATRCIRAAPQQKYTLMQLWFRRVGALVYWLWDQSRNGKVVSSNPNI